MVRWLENPLCDSKKLSSHAPRVGAGEPCASAALAVWKARQPQPRLTEMDPIFWVVLSRLWTGWRHSLQLVRPETVVGWHRQDSDATGRGRVGPDPVGPGL